jgi:hypothetical protein
MRLRQRRRIRRRSIQPQNRVARAAAAVHPLVGFPRERDAAEHTAEDFYAFSKKPGAYIWTGTRPAGGGMLQSAL